MVAVPVATGVITPVLLFIVATAPLLLVHTPPAVPLVLRVAGLPMHIEVLPVMVPAETLAFTVIVMVVSTGGTAATGYTVLDGRGACSQSG